ncbi:MAG: GNAT family N-acetyltransferase [Anaerolineae bacterium]|nr:GNAT family N-acetyltransferase [Anaerolineae bacterium]
MLTIRLLTEPDIQPIAAAFAELGWNKPASQYARYLAEQESGLRTVFVAFVDEAFAGYVTVLWQSGYPPFREANIPEIADFNVLPELRRQGIGGRLMDAAEASVAERFPVVGIGVGLFADYGAAQRMYMKRGYIPDGRGIFTQGHFVQYNESIVIDDEPALYFMKYLKPSF